MRKFLSIYKKLKKLQITNQVISEQEITKIVFKIFNSYMNKFNELDIIRKRNFIKSLVNSMETDGENIYMSLFGSDNNTLITENQLIDDEIAYKQKMSFLQNTILTLFFQVIIVNEILMYFRADKKNSKNISIYDGISYDKEGNEVTILDVLKTEDPDFNEEIFKNDNIKLLKEYMNILTPRERDVLTKRYGLDNNDEITQKEIAKNLGISRSYVSRIEKRAITKILREFIKNDTKK